LAARKAARNAAAPAFGAASTCSSRTHYKSQTFDSDVNLVRPLRKTVEMGVEGGEGAILVLREEDLLISKASRPIPRGGVVTGRIILGVPGNRIAEIRRGSVRITVRIVDYLGTPYEGVLDLLPVDPNEPMGPIEVLPGEQMIKVKRPRTTRIGAEN
jgi:hypothetical protein